MLIYLISIAAILLLIKLILIKYEIKRIRNEALNMLSSKENNSMLRTNRVDASLDKLIDAINSLAKKGREASEKTNIEKKNLQMQITGISHDLRTPLSSILGYIELAEETDDDKKRAEYLEIVKKRSKILQTLINDFYYLSMIEDPGYKLQMEIIRISSVLEDTLLTFYDDFTNKNIEIELDITAGTEVLTSKDNMIRVYSNLIQNALKYNEGRVKIFHGLKDGELITSFENDFKEKIDTEMIFDRFFTGDKSRHGENSGIGLYVVRLLLTKMGHSIVARQEGNKVIMEIKYMK